MYKITMFSKTYRRIETDDDFSFQYLDRGMWCYWYVLPKATISIYPKAGT